MDSRYFIEKIFDLKNVDFWKVVFYGYQLNLIDNLFLIDLATELLISDRLNDSLVIDLAVLSESNSKMAGIILAEKLKINFWEYEEKVTYNKIWFSMILNEKVNFLISKIKSSENIEASQGFFDELQITQANIMKLMIEDESITISHNLWEFIHDFDRIDDKSTKEFVFKKIKNGSYFPT